MAKSTQDDNHEIAAIKAELADLRQALLSLREGSHRPDWSLQERIAVAELIDEYIRPVNASLNWRRVAAKLTARLMRHCGEGGLTVRTCADVRFFPKEPAIAFTLACRDELIGTSRADPRQFTLLTFPS